MIWQFFIEHPYIFLTIQAIIKATIWFILVSIVMSFVYQFTWNNKETLIPYWVKLKESTIALKWLFLAEIIINFFIIIWPLIKLIVELISIMWAYWYLKNKFHHNYKLNLKDANNFANNIIIRTIMWLLIFWMLVFAIQVYRMEGWI